MQILIAKDKEISSKNLQKYTKEHTKNRKNKTIILDIKEHHTAQI